MNVDLLDGTYELFRHYYGLPAETREASPVAGARAVVENVVSLLAEGVTHLGIATDHVIESFRNDLWPGYKSSEGMDKAILSQFGLLEDALDALGVRLWAMTELEADDALASAAAVAAADPAVDRVRILTPDKDLAQCVRGDRVVLVDRRRRETIDEAGVLAKFGVIPESIPDWLALVGDSADGYPGLPGWGAKTAAALLRHYVHASAIPDDATAWEVPVRGAGRLAQTLVRGREALALFLDLATLRLDATLLADGVESLRWVGPTAAFAGICDVLHAPYLAARAAAVAAARS